MSSIQAPSNCPSCQSVLEWVNHILYCRNPLCGEQSQKKVEHFAKTLKIKGLGPAAIQKLGMTHINDIYAFSVEELEIALDSEKLGQKLYAEIENSKEAPLDMLLPAMSIRLIGKTATDKLSTVCKTLDDVSEDSCRQAGLGQVATRSLLTWLEQELPFIELPHSWKFAERNHVATRAGVVCISGKLTSYKTKAEAANILKEYGYTIKDSVTKDVTILVNESGIESQKTIKARESGVTIVENLVDFLEEKHGIA